VLGLAHSSAGKDWPRKLNARILGDLNMLDALGDKFASGEGLQDALFGSPAMLFQNDEIDGLLQSINKSRDGRNESLLGALLTLNTSANTRYPMRRKATQKGDKAQAPFIDQPCLVLFGTAVPGHYYDALSSRMMTNGFLARFVTVEAGKRATGQDARILDVPPRILDAARWWTNYQPTPGNLATVYPMPAIVPYSVGARGELKEVRAAFDAEYSKAEDCGDETAMTVFGRAGEHVHKLALLYAVSKSPRSPEINAVAVDWAQEFVTTQARRMLFRAKLHVAVNPFDELCQKFKRQLADSPERRAVHSRLLKAMRCDAATFQKIVQTLSQQGDLATEERLANNGRLVPMYRLLRV